MPFDDAHFAAVKLEVSRHLEDAETSKLAHWDAAAVYERRHKIWIGLPATLLSLLLTWMLSADVKAFFAMDGAFKVVADNIPVILSLVVSLLTGIGAFLNFSELAGKHRAAAENLNALCRDCKNWDTDFPDFAMCDKAVQTVQGYRKRLNEINRDAPQIPKWAWLSVKKQRAQGSTEYESEKKTRPG